LAISSNFALLFRSKCSIRPGRQAALTARRASLKIIESSTSIARVIINLEKGVDAEKENLAFQLTNSFSWVKESKTYDEVLGEFRAEEGRNFGIPGLLSINYIVAIVTAVIGVFF